MKTLYRIAAILTIWAWCAACSPAEWAQAGNTVGTIVDTAALVRADQIRGKAATAEAAARAGDSFAAMRALAEAQALVAAELARRPAVCPALPGAMAPLAPSATASVTAAPVPAVIQ